MLRYLYIKKPILMEQKAMLNERVSNIVYHYTTRQGLEGILRQNKLEMNGDSTQKMSYVSFGRNKNAVMGYSADRYWLHVRITVDGDKLNTRFRGKPYDYYKLNTKDHRFSDDRRTNRNPLARNSYMNTMTEFEDRIEVPAGYKSKWWAGGILNFSQYILRIDYLVLYRENTVEFTEEYNLLEKIAEYAADCNVLDLIHIYSNKGEFEAQTNENYSLSRFLSVKQDVILNNDQYNPKGFLDDDTAEYEFEIESEQPKIIKPKLEEQKCDRLIKCSKEDIISGRWRTMLTEKYYKSPQQPEVSQDDEMNPQNVNIHNYKQCSSPRDSKSNKLGWRDSKTPGSGSKYLDVDGVDGKYRYADHWHRIRIKTFVPRQCPQFKNPDGTISFTIYILQAKNTEHTNNLEPSDEDWQKFRQLFSKYETELLWNNGATIDVENGEITLKIPKNYDPGDSVPRQQLCELLKKYRCAVLS
jgi:hypothetical protein